jgi:hypothetical protein
MRSLRRFADESGQTVVLAALSMVVVMAFVGFAVDVGHLRLAKRQLQIAADAVALAAAREIRVCGVNNTSGSTCPYMMAAAKSALTENNPGYTATSAFITCGTSPGSALTLELNGPPCHLPSDPNYKKPGYVEAVVSEQVGTYFAQILGIPRIPISARAEASRNLSPPCIYALDPTGAGAITLAIGVAMKFNCAIVDESNSSSALSGLVCIGVSAPKIIVHGGVGTLLDIGCPSPQLNAPVPTPADPMAYLPPPSNANAHCGTTTASPYSGSPTQVNLTLGLLDSVVFNPGVYCGGISITASVATNIVFNSVTSANPAYVLRDGQGYLLGVGLLGIQILIPSPFPTGGLEMPIGVLSSVSGNNVMFYDEGNITNPGGSVGNISITATVPVGSFNLSAPTSGEYAGVLFFQAHGVTTPGTFTAGLLSGSNLQGAIYMPDAPITYAVDAIAANNNILVAKDINFGLVSLISGFGTSQAPSSLGSPLVGDDAVLVQ